MNLGRVVLGDFFVGRVDLGRVVRNSDNSQKLRTL